MLDFTFLKIANRYLILKTRSINRVDFKNFFSLNVLEYYEKENSKRESGKMQNGSSLSFPRSVIKLFQISGSSAFGVSNSLLQID